MVKGLFITVEGPDGAGKTTVIRELLPKLEKVFSQPIVVTREPGGNRIAEEIREIILNPQNTAMDARTEALLYAASRRQHLAEKIVPALDAGEMVICDRFVDSSLAYQGHARGIGVAEVAAINQFATANLTPDLTLYLDVEAHIGIQRINQAKENRQFDRLDQEKLEFHEKVREAYLDLVKQNPERMVLIDASMEVEQVVEECYRTILEKLL